MCSIRKASLVKLTLSSLDSLWMSSVRGMVACGLHFGPVWLFGTTAAPRLLSDNSLDLKGTTDSLLTTGRLTASCKEAMLSWLANSTTAYVPCRFKTVFIIDQCVLFNWDNADCEVQIRHCNGNVCVIQDKTLYWIFFFITYIAFIKETVLDVPVYW